jgi:LuxR family glucitol operon transcriptional activator
MSDSLTAEKALEFVEDLLVRQSGRRLSEDEKAIFRGSWEGLTYEQIRGKFNIYTHIVDVRKAGGQLWNTIADLFELPPDEVTKYTFPGFVEQQWKLQEELETSVSIDSSVNLKSPSETERLNISRARLSSTPYQNLPPQHNEFIGREEQLCQLMRYLSEDHPANILQVDGIAGVGKTALVLEAAYRCLDYRERGDSSQILYEGTNLQCNIPFFEVLIFVSAKNYHLLPNSSYVRRLVVTRTLQDIYRTISQVLDDPTIPNIDANSPKTDYFHEITTKISSALKSKNRVLLIVDNLETIEDRDKVLSFLFELPIKSIITTREQSGFCPIRLDSLPEKESKLLIEQQLTEKCLDVTEDEKDDIYKITGGIPMVIIWSIGRLAQGSSLETIKFDLTDPDGEIAEFSFKTSLRDIQDTLAYHLLMTLSIFKQAPNWESVIFVAGLGTQPEGRIRREIETLQRLSLVRYHNGRYRMLPLTREYALAELQKHQDFKDQALNRWVEWYIDFAKREHNRDRLERFTLGYKNIEEEWENLVSVLHFCKDENRYEQLKELWSYLNNYTNLRGYWKDRLSWLNHLTDVSIAKGDYGTAVNTMSRQGRILLLMGQPEQLQKAEELLLNAWSLSSHADFSDKDYVLNHLAGLYLRLDNYKECHQWLDREQKVLNEQDDLTDSERLRYQIYIDRERAEVLFHEKRYKLSKEVCKSVIEKSIQIDQGYGLRNGNYAKKILADIAIEEKELTLAETLLAEVYREVEFHGDKRRVAYCLVSLAKLEKEKGDTSQSKTYLSQASSHFKNIGMIRDVEIIKQLKKSL